MKVSIMSFSSTLRKYPTQWTWQDNHLKSHHPTLIASESTKDCSWSSSPITFVAGAGGGDEAQQAPLLHVS